MAAKKKHRKKRRKMTALQLKYFGPRKKKRAAKKRARKKNPSALSLMPYFGLYAKKGAGPRMHFDGGKFSNNGRAVGFPTMTAARTTGAMLLHRFPVLKGYVISVEPLRGKA